MEFASDLGFRILADALHQGVILVDEDDQVVFMNERAEAICNRRVDACAGHKIAVVLEDSLGASKAETFGLAQSGFATAEGSGVELRRVRLEGAHAAILLTEDPERALPERDFWAWARDEVTRARARATDVSIAVVDGVAPEDGSELISSLGRRARCGAAPYGAKQLVVVLPGASTLGAEAFALRVRSLLEERGMPARVGTASLRELGPTDSDPLATLQALLLGALADSGRDRADQDADLARATGVFRRVA